MSVNKVNILDLFMLGFWVILHEFHKIKNEYKNGKNDFRDVHYLVLFL